MSSAQHNSNSPLLRLPAEIRNQIYDYVIGGQTYAVYEASLEKPSYYLNRERGQGLHWHEQTALSRTCRQFRHDTSLLFFQNNIFMANYLNSSSAMKGWMHSLQPYHASAIQAILCELWGPRRDPEALKLLLADWAGIKRVGVYSYSSSGHHMANQGTLKIAGFELGETVEDRRFESSIIMWYEWS